MQDLGVCTYLRMTMGESNTLPLLAAQAHNPSQLDSDAVRNFAAFAVTRQHIGITYYP